MKTWYESKTGNEQGLVIEEGTGRNVAVTYDKADAPLVAAAPALLVALEAMQTAYLRTCKRLPVSAEDVIAEESAHAAIARAKGEA